MLLQSIELQNFRQFINEKIDFSTDPDRNVTLIIGENGTGKTTFAQAFFWCLYGETDFTDKIMLNRILAEQMTPDQKIIVKVVLKLIHGSATYEIIRTQEYKKSYSNKVIGANTALNIAVKSADGNTRYLKQLECEAEIKKILPKELSNYFFFDGERIEKMSKEIASGRKSSGFSNAVVGLTGLKATLAALGHLAPTRTNSVMGKFNEAYTGDSSGKIQQLSKRIDELQSELERIAERLVEIDDEVDAALSAKAKFEQDIKQYADGEKLQNERDRLTTELQKLKKLKAQTAEKIEQIKKDLMLIESQEDSGEILIEYQDTLDVNTAILRVKERKHRLAEQEKSLASRIAAAERQKEAEEAVLEAVAPPEVEAPAETDDLFELSFKVTAPIEKLRALKKFLDDGGYHYEQL